MRQAFDWYQLKYQAGYLGECQMVSCTADHASCLKFNINSGNDLPESWQSYNHPVPVGICDKYVLGAVHKWRNHRYVASYARHEGG